MKPLRITLLALAGLALLAPAASASFAGDNGRIYFSTSRQGQGIMPHLFSMTPRGTDIDPVADLPGAQREPAVSPAADLLAFWSYGGGNSDLWTVGTDGLGAGLLADSSTNTQPAFTADGETVAYRDLVDGPGEQSDEHIFTVPAGGGSSTPLLAEPGERYRMAGVLGGRRADGVHAGGREPAVTELERYVAGADGSEPVQVTNLRGDEYGPDFSPNGRRIVFWARSRSGESDIYSIRTDGTSFRRLTPRDGENAWAPDYSPNGRGIVYVADVGEYPDIIRMNADGSHRRALTHLKRRALQPDWATKPAG